MIRRSASYGPMLPCEEKWKIWKSIVAV